MMANLPSLGIENITLTISVDPEKQQEVQGRIDKALTMFPNSLEVQRPHGRYRFGYSLTAPNGEAINIEAQPTREGYNYIRVDYSPDQIGQEGAECLADYLSNVLGTTYRDAFYGGRLQKMVVSFDLYDVELDDLWIYRTGSREKQTAMIFNANLGLESICIGYDSARQLSFSQAECPSPDTQPCVRVEYIHDKGNYTLADFYVLLENPLSSLTIRRYAELPGLMDHVQSRG